MKNLFVLIKTFTGPLTSAFILAAALTACGGGSRTADRNPNGKGPAAISAVSDTSTALTVPAAYVILSKTGISNVTGSTVTGNIAVSPAADTYITGFALAQDPSTEFSLSSSVVGKVYAADYGVPTPANLTAAISAMEAAYTDAAGRTLPDFVELYTGAIGSQTLVPGLYKWSNTVTIDTDVTISGSANDIWIFQIAGDVTMAANKQVILAGGALAKNIFWQVAGQVSVGAGSSFAGIIFSKTAIVFDTLASLSGRAFAQTAVTLDNNVITQP